MSRSTTNIALSHDNHSTSILELPSCSSMTQIQEPFTPSPITILTSSLYANPVVPLKVIKDVIQKVKLLFQNSIYNPMSTDLLKFYQNGDISKDCFNHLQSKINQLMSSLDKNSTEHKRIATFKNQGTYIEPVEYSIGQRMEASYTSANNFQYLPVTSTGQHTPFRLVLKKF